MNENENLVTEVAENTEQPAEQTQQPAKTYTQEEVDAIVGRKKARWEAKMRKENERTYGGLIETLEAGTGEKGVDRLNDVFTKFYTEKGKITKKPTIQHSEKEIEILARAEADEIIQSGFDEVVEEVDRLAELGAANMTAREKAVFKVLAEHRQKAETENELAKIGVTEDVYNSEDFKEFRKMFTKDTPITKVYETYQKTQPKKEPKTMGSMKSTAAADDTLKDFYSFEEASKFTVEDFNKNPELFKRVKASMPKWK